MRFLYDWVKEYIEVNLPPQELSELLTMLGIEVENYSKDSEGEILFELELTSNRPDCANMVGIAREIGAALKKRVKYPACKIVEGKKKIQDFIQVKVQEPKLCPRYAARLIKGVKVGPAPNWLKFRLEKVGLRSINNVVDATNYVLMELGHPLHTFDADTLSKNQLIIRPAKEREKVITIDKVERSLTPDILVIADGEKAQAIAGIMGGEASEVKDLTENVLIESAYFNKIAIRRAGKKLNMMTEASYRFERGTDPEGLIFSLNRATELIQRLAGGEIARGIIDIYKKPISKVTLELRLARLNELLGTNLKTNQVKGILKGLEFKIKASSKKKIKVLVPTFRGDIEREIDLIEEVARHHGYNKIAASLPSITISVSPQTLVEKVKNTVYAALIKFGFQEVSNYSFINSEELVRVNLNSQTLERDFIKINNPISQEQNIMRPTLLLGLLNNLVWNFNRQIEELKIFEIGKIFFSKGEKKKFSEKLAVSLALLGASFDLFELKGIIEALFEILGITSIRFKKGGRACFHPQNSAQIIKDDKEIGYWGEFSPFIQERLGLKEKILGAEIILDEILAEVNLDRHFQPLPKFPAIRRDLSLLVPLKVTSEEIISLIKKEGGELIEKIELFDFYQGEQIPKDFRSLGYSLTYRSLTKTLTDEEVNQIHKKISQVLASRLEIKIRGG